MTIKSYLYHELQSHFYFFLKKKMEKYCEMGQGRERGREKAEFCRIKPQQLGPIESILKLHGWDSYQSGKLIKLTDRFVAC